MRCLAVLIVLSLAIATAPQSRQLSPAMTSLVETERAFARMSVAQGRRAAFLAFFAEDALFFTPQPTIAPPRIRSWPVAGAFTLDWEPRFGDVARSGDLGYTTGPFIRTSPDITARVVGTGWYFTVWKLQPDSVWKVLIDTGISSPPVGALRPSTFEMAATERAPGRRARLSLDAADRALCDAIASTGWSRALTGAGTDSTRLYRDGVAPMKGIGAIRSYLAATDARARCEPVKDEAATAGDLGYTYGRYAVGPSPSDTGYYLRVWKRLAGEWKLAIDLLVAGA